MFGKTFTTFFTLTAAALSASALSIDTPEKLTECGTVALSWHGLNAPFTLHVLPSCESESEDPLLVLPPMNATTYDWTVSIPSKTGAIAFAIVDAKGNEAYTDEVDIAKGSAACLNAVSSSSVAPTNTGSLVSTSVGGTPTTLVVSATSTTTGTPYAPVNAGSGSSGSSVNTDNSNNNNNTNGATTNTASILVGAIGVVAGFFTLL